MPKKNNPSLKPVKVIAHDHGPSFGMYHRFPDLTHSVVKDGGSNYGTLEKAPPKPKEKNELNYFV